LGRGRPLKGFGGKKKYMTLNSISGVGGNERGSRVLNSAARFHYKSFENLSGENPREGGKTMGVNNEKRSGTDPIL